MEGFAGVTTIDTSVGPVTVSVSAELTTLSSVAVMLLVPVPTPLARPPAAMDPTKEFEEAHVTLFVRFCVLESL
jgi:hypothetical protein